MRKRPNWNAGSMRPSGPKRGENYRTSEMRLRVGRMSLPLALGLHIVNSQVSWSRCFPNCRPPNRPAAISTPSSIRLGMLPKTSSVCCRSSSAHCHSLISSKQTCTQFYSRPDCASLLPIRRSRAGRLARVAIRSTRRRPRLCCRHSYRAGRRSRFHDRALPSHAGVPDPRHNGDSLAKHTNHEAVLPADEWDDAMPVYAFRPRMVCTRCGIISADARPNWREMQASGNWA